MKVNKITLTFGALTVAFILSLANAQSCLCILEDSVKYPGTFKWNCQGHALISIPTECFLENNDQVSELVMTDNLLTSVQAGDFDIFPNIKSLSLDFNSIVSVDETSFYSLSSLEIINFSENQNLVLPYNVFTNSSTLKELYLVSTQLGTLPDLKTLTALEALDARSCLLPTLPRPLFGKIQEGEFYLNFFGNEFVDVAADILLPIPNGATVNLDFEVIIWAVDEYQHYDVLNKNWNINLDLEESIKVCGYDGTPTDESMC